MSFKDEHGQDKYSDINVFPITTNLNIAIQPVLKDVANIFYNDSTLCKHNGDNISFYSVKIGVSIN